MIILGLVLLVVLGIGVPLSWYTTRKHRTLHSDAVQRMDYNAARYAKNAENRTVGQTFGFVVAVLGLIAMFYLFG